MSNTSLTLSLSIGDEYGHVVGISVSGISLVCVVPVNFVPG